MILVRSRISLTAAFIHLAIVSGQLLVRNITVDDKNPAIKYTGTWSTGTSKEADSYSGGHQSTNRSNAYATFNFTGVAVYYMMPLFWGYTDGVATLLTLDSGPPQLVNITRVGSEPTTSAVRWSASGLTNGPHTVRVSLGRSAKGELARWGLVDAFIYTVEGDIPVARDEPEDGSTTPTPSSNAQALVSLQKCSPCGTSLCSFSPQESPSHDTYVVVVGKPVSNCDDDNENNQTVTSKYTNEMLITDTWTIDFSIGVSFVGLNVQGGHSWSKSMGVKASQEVSFSIPPGQMAALTATVNYKKTSGKMFIDSTAYPFSSIQPTDIKGYNVKYADCDDLFSAVTLSSIDCHINPANSATFTHRYPRWLMIGLIGILLLWNMI